MQHIIKVSFNLTIKYLKDIENRGNLMTRKILLFIYFFILSADSLNYNIDSNIDIANNTNSNLPIFSKFISAGFDNIFYLNDNGSALLKGGSGSFAIILPSISTRLDYLAYSGHGDFRLGPRDGMYDAKGWYFANTLQSRNIFASNDYGFNEINFKLGISLFSPKDYKDLAHISQVYQFDIRYAFNFLYENFIYTPYVNLSNLLYKDNISGFSQFIEVGFNTKYKGDLISGFVDIAFMQDIIKDNSHSVFITPDLSFLYLNAPASSLNLKIMASTNNYKSFSINGSLNLNYAINYFSFTIYPQITATYKF